MTFTGRIRTYLLIVALLPPLILMLVIYLLSVRQIERADRRLAHENLLKFQAFHDRFRSEIERDIEAVLESPSLTRALVLLRSGREEQVDLAERREGLDFLEITDGRGRVLASHHRPGLLNESLLSRFNRRDPTDVDYLPTVEYDINGLHAAYAYLVPVDSDLYLYTGRYLDTRFTGYAEQLLGAEVDILFADSVTSDVAHMDPGKLYTVAGRLQAVVAGGPEHGFYVVAGFRPDVQRPAFGPLIAVTALVAAGSMILALAIGIYVTGRAKREVENLVKATTRVAAGDFSTTVMAYEEGEFSQLADSFTAMTMKLRKLQRELATSEKIAAWQALGRMIAHEVKNPLTPIAIGIDDLRRSYQEKRDDFSAVLDETTTTIRTEVRRLTGLLDDFVKFARMRPPQQVPVSLPRLAEEIETLYRREVDTKRLLVKAEPDDREVTLDPDMVRQMLVNLIKNGLEAGDATEVHVSLSADANRLAITVEDNGPGFPDEILRESVQPYVSTKKKGAGLGLVICQRIVHDHGGYMELYNRRQGGAGIAIVIPHEHG